jgi:hypothetical protein
LRLAWEQAFRIVDKIIHLLLYPEANAMPHENRREGGKTDLVDYARIALVRRQRISVGSPHSFAVCAESAQSL